MATSEAECVMCPVMAINDQKLELDHSKTSLDKYFSAEASDEQVKTKEKRKKQQDKKEEIKDNVVKFYMIDGTTTFKSLAKMTQAIFKRDYSDVENFIEYGRDFKPVFVPDSYIPANPEVLNLEKEQEIMDKLKHESLIESFNSAGTSKDDQEIEEGPASKRVKTMSSKFHQEKSSQIEKKVSEMLKDFYADKSERAHQNIMVFQNITINSKHEKSDTKQEIDFLILNHSTMAITMIEVKKTLEDKFGKTSGVKRVQKQLPRAKALFEEWFGSDISSGWKYQSLLFCKKIDEDLRLCRKCQRSIVTNKKELFECLRKQKKLEKHEKESFNEFGIMCRYLAYCVSKTEVPTRGKIPIFIQNSMRACSSPENIELWLSLNNSQMMILGLDYVVFIASYGTGKTVMMVEKAKILNEKGGNILFLIIVFTERDSLLARDLKIKMDAFTNVTVVAKNEEGLTKEFIESFKKYDHILIDECYENPQSQMKDSLKWTLIQKEIEKAERKTVWVSISGAYRSGKTMSSLSESYLELARKNVHKMFPSKRFSFPQLDINFRQPWHLRSYSNLVIGTGADVEINTQLVRNAKSPPNITEGNFRRTKNPKVDLLGKSNQIVYVVDSGHGAIEKIRKWADKFFPQERKPLFLFDDSSIENCNDEEIEKWIERKSGYTAKDLITTYDYLRGYEHHTIAFLDITSFQDVIPGLTRCMGEIIDATAAIPGSSSLNCDCFFKIRDDDELLKDFANSLSEHHFEEHQTVIFNKDPGISKEMARSLHLVNCKDPYQLAIKAALSNDHPIHYYFNEEQPTLLVKGGYEKDISHPLKIEIHFEWKCQACPCNDCSSKNKDLTLKWSKAFIQKIDTGNVLLHKDMKTVYVESCSKYIDELSNKIAAFASNMLVILHDEEIGPEISEVFKEANKTILEIDLCSWLQDSTCGSLVISDKEFDEIDELQFRSIPAILVVRKIWRKLPSSSSYSDCHHGSRVVNT